MRNTLTHFPVRKKKLRATAHLHSINTLERGFDSFMSTFVLNYLPLF